MVKTYLTQLLSKVMKVDLVIAKKGGGSLQASAALWEK